MAKSTVVIQLKRPKESTYDANRDGRLSPSERRNYDAAMAEWNKKKHGGTEKKVAPSVQRKRDRDEQDKKDEKRRKKNKTGSDRYDREADRRASRSRVADNVREREDRDRAAGKPRPKHRKDDDARARSRQDTYDRAMQVKIDMEQNKQTMPYDGRPPPSNRARLASKGRHVFQGYYWTYKPVRAGKGQRRDKAGDVIEDSTRGSWKRGEKTQAPPRRKPTTSGRRMDTP